MKDMGNYPIAAKPAALQAVFLVSYGAMLFGCAATIASLLLTKMLGEIPTYAGGKGSNLAKEGTWENETTLTLLGVYTGKPRWFKFLLLYCEFGDHIYL